MWQTTVKAAETRMTKIPASKWRHTWLAAAWALGALLVVWGSTRGTFDATSRQYGANWPGDLRRAFIELGVETGALYLILRPWSYAASWKRALSAFVLFVPWTMLGGFGTIHAGRVASYHFLWLVIMTVGLFAMTIISSAASRALARHDLTTAVE
jgi:hypothetical protein